MNRRKALEKLREKLLKKEVILCICVFMLSSVRVYSDTAPFGLPALCAVSAADNPLYLIFYLGGVLRANIGFTAILRQITACILLLISKKLFKKIKLPDFLVCGIAIVLGGAFSLSVRGITPLHVALAIGEAVVAAAFCPIFKVALLVLLDREKRQHATDTDTFAVLIFIMSVACGFAGAELLGLSIPSAAVAAIAMCCAYKYNVNTAAVTGMAVGFFYAVFSMWNAAAVCYFAASAFLSSLLKRFGKLCVPAVYAVLLVLFYYTGITITTISFLDFAIAAIIFSVIPAGAFDAINTLSADDREKQSCLRLSEKLGSLADTFSSISEIFACFDIGEVTDNCDDTVKNTENEVCGACTFKRNCNVKSAKTLSRLYPMISQSGKINAKTLEKELRGCYRKKELITGLAKNYQLARTEALWKTRMNEGTEAVSGQMKCISGMFTKLSGESESLILRDSVAEKELTMAFKKAGITVKGLSAGRNSKGSFEVILEAIPCKGLGRCDNRVPKIIKEVLNIETERFGIKNCDRCRCGYCEVTAYSIITAHMSVPCEKVSGDSVAFARIDSRHFAIALSDGMGTGREASIASSAAVHLAVRLLAVGMDIESSVKMINSLLLNRGKSGFATMDIAVIDLTTGECEYSKNGAASGYVLTCGGKTQRIFCEGSPLGALGRPEINIKKLKLHDGDTLLIMSDGVCDALGCDGEKGLENIIDEFTLGTTNELAAYITQKAYTASDRKPKDDMTVIAAGCIKRHKIGNTHEKRRLNA